METLQLNGFQGGVIVTERGSVDYLKSKKVEWAKEGRICWFSNVETKRNCESPHVE